MGNGLGIASMVLGIISVILSIFVLTRLVLMAWITDNPMVIAGAFIFGIIVIIIAAVGMILGLISMINDESKAFAIIGLILCTITVIIIAPNMFLGATAIAFT